MKNQMNELNMSLSLLQKGATACAGRYPSKVGHEDAKTQRNTKAAGSHEDTKAQSGSKPMQLSPRGSRGLTEDNKLGDASCVGMTAPNNRQPCPFRAGTFGRVSTLLATVICQLATILLLFTTQADAQAISRMPYDSIRMFTLSGSGSTLIVENATRNRTGGFLQNTWNGRTQFSYAVDSIRVSGDTLYYHRGDGWHYKKMGYISASESDPVFVAHVANTISAANISNWNTGYNKRVVGIGLAGTSTKTITLTLGDGSLLAAAFNDQGLTSYDETDPTVPAHVKAITDTSISRWNTAWTEYVKDMVIEKDTVTNIVTIYLSKNGGKFLIGSFSVGAGGGGPSNDDLHDVSTRGSATSHTIDAGGFTTDSGPAMMPEGLKLDSSAGLTLIDNADGDLVMHNHSTGFKTTLRTSNTADREHSFQDKSGVVAHTSDIADTSALLRNLISSKVPLARTITINGTTYDLSADRSWTIATNVGSVAWGSITGTLSGQTDLQNALNSKLNISDTVNTRTRVYAGNGVIITGTFPNHTVRADTGLLAARLRLYNVNDSMKVVNDARYVQLGGSYANPTWITSLAWSKLTGVPSIVTQASAVVNNGNALSASTQNPTSQPTHVFAWNGGVSQYVRGDGTLANVSGLGSSDGNNYPTALSYSSDTLRVQRNGLAELYAVIPLSVKVDVQRFLDSVLVLKNLYTLPVGRVAIGDANNKITSSANFTYVGTQLHVNKDDKWGALHTGHIFLKEDDWSIPPGVATGKGVIYPQNDGKLYWRNSGGTIYDLTAVGAGGGSGISSLNGLTGSAQTFAINNGGTFGFTSSGTTHTLNIPTASASNKGLLSSSDWLVFNGKAAGNHTHTIQQAIDAGNTLTEGTQIKSNKSIVSFYNDSLKLEADEHLVLDANKIILRKLASETNRGLQVESDGMVTTFDLVGTISALIADSLAAYKPKFYIDSVSLIGDGTVNNKVRINPTWLDSVIAAAGGGGGGSQLATPSPLVADAISATQVKLDWTNVANESSYEVQRSTNGSTWSTINSPAANATTYTDAGRTASTLYHYRIKAVGDGDTYLNSAYTSDTATTWAGAGGGSSTAVVTSFTPASLRSDFGADLGFGFTVGNTAITVTEVSRWVNSGNNQTHTLKIVDASGTVMVSTSTNLAGASVGWKWETVSPTVLAANTKYYIFSSETVTGDTWSDNKPHTVLPVITNTIASYSEGGVISEAAGLTSYQYVGVNFKIAD